MSLGEDDADAARNALASDLAAWDGGILVLDSDLSEELAAPAYGTLGNALADALAAARTSGRPCSRIYGDDLDQEDDFARSAAREVARLIAGKTCPSVALTGCWASSDGSSGCVTAVRKALDQAGFQTLLLPGAVLEPDDPARVARRPSR